MIKVKVPATTANLGPGFDTLGMSLDFYNQILVEHNSTGLEIIINGNGKKELATDKSNLVYYVMSRLFEKVGYTDHNLTIKLDNKIPLARGLGSSAAAIVGGLVAANKLLGDKLSQDELLDLAVEIEGHPDNVAPALFGGVVITTIHGGEIVHKKIAVPDLKVVVAIPDYQLSTKKAREVLPDKVDFDDAIFNISQTALLISGLVSSDYQLISQALSDKLHQPYRAKLIPGFEEIKKDLAGLALGVMLSGSGPTVIALTVENEVEIGERMVEIFKKHQIKADYLVTAPTNQGVVVEEGAN